MTLFLDRIDTAPVINLDLDSQFLQWISILVDALNENLSDIQNVVQSQSIVTGTTQDVEVNSLYVTTNVALTTFQLPDMCSIGSRVTVAGFGTGGWSILVGAGQTIQLGQAGATASASVSSSNRYDSIELICVQEDLTWSTLSTQTTGFVIV